jgi:hypothetical protein
VSADFETGQRELGGPQDAVHAGNADLEFGRYGLPCHAFPGEALIFITTVAQYPPRRNLDVA